MQLQKDRLNFFLKIPNFHFFLILKSTCSIHGGGGGSISKIEFPNVVAFYQVYNKVHLVISSQRSLVFPMSNKAGLLYTGQ